MVGGNPQLTLLVALYGGDTIVGKSVGGGIMVHLTRLQVIAEQTVVRAIPQTTVVLTNHTYRLTVVQTVRVEHLRPAAAGDVEAADTHRRGGIDTLSVGRHMNL